MRLTLTGYLPKVAALFGVVGLSACEPVSDATPVSGTPAPGPKSLGVSQAVKYFGDVCVDDAAGFGDATESLSIPAFVQSPTTTTYFHQRLNLSFKLIPKRRGVACSMVFVSEEEAEDLGLALAYRTSREGDIRTDPETGAVSSDGPGKKTFFFFPLDQTNYYRAVLGNPN